MQGILVPHAIAIQLANYNYYIVEDANHLTICKPPNKDHPSYFLLLNFLKICMEVKTSNLNLLNSYMFM
jgi:Cys-tRNA synthase (O-phospho-L-seryl-tRNA:Cys-tRNA synthase)